MPEGNIKYSLPEQTMTMNAVRESVLGSIVPAWLPLQEVLVALMLVLGGAFGWFLPNLLVRGRKLKPSKKKLRVGFAHPDLGIGGAERLIVDAAVGLQRLGHDVTIYTSHHPHHHCFEETLPKAQGGVLQVEVWCMHVGGEDCDTLMSATGGRYNAFGVFRTCLQ